MTMAYEVRIGAWNIRTSEPGTLDAELLDVYDSSGERRLYKSMTLSQHVLHWGEGPGFLSLDRVAAERLILAPAREEARSVAIHPECSICRRRHGREVQHACE